MAAAASAPGREEGGGGSGGGGRREEGGSEKPGDRGGGGGGGWGVWGVAGAEQSGADPAPSLRLGARARPRPLLPARRGGRGQAGEELPYVPKGAKLRGDPYKERYPRGETCPWVDLQTQETPKGDILTKIIPYADTPPRSDPPGRHSHGLIVSTGRTSPIRNSPLTLKIIPS